MEYPFPIEPDAIWSATDLAAAFCRPGMMDPTDHEVATVVAVMLAEAGGNPLGRGTPGHSVWNGQAVRWVDLGICQLNSFYHCTPGVEAFPGMSALTVDEAFTALTNIDRAWDVMNRGAAYPWAVNLSWWTAYKNGSFDSHYDTAYAGVVAYRQWLEANS